MQRRCLVCNKEFEPKNYWQKYCKATCKQAMWAKKKFDKGQYTHTLTFKNGEKPLLNTYIPSKNDIYEVKITFYFPIVNRLYKKTKDKIKQGEKIYCDSKPDLDNIVKPVLDKLTGIIWKDDSQIVKLILEKFYSTKSDIDIEVRVLC
jgi:Holliday junction resolvase RusA-like endonuclease